MGRQIKMPEGAHHVVISTSSEGEISILEVMLSLRRQWVLICLVTLVVTLSVLALVVMMPKVYRAEVLLLTPQQSDVAHFNIPDLFATSEQELYIYSTTTEDLYAAMLRNLRSNSLRHQFFSERNLYDQLKETEGAGKGEYGTFQKKFNELLLVKDGGARNREDLEYVSVILDGSRAELIAQWINDFVDFIDTYTVREVINTINTKIRVKKRGLKERMASLRLTARQQRENDLDRLEAALDIARKVGLDTAVVSKDSANNPQSDNNALVQEYGKGVLILEAEIEALKNRKSDDPYISGLYEVKEQFIFLKNIKPQMDNMHAARIDQPARRVDIPVKPRMKLMVFMGGVVGVIMGIMVALIRCLFARQCQVLGQDKSLC